MYTPCFLPFGKRFKKNLTVLCSDQIKNIMKQKSFHPSTLILFSALIVAICFAGRAIGSSPASANKHLAASVDSVLDEIRKVELLTREALNSGDTALFIKTFTPDACLLPPNAPMLSGPRGISQFFKGARQAGVRDAEFHNLGLYGQTEDYVTQQGSFELFDGAQHELNKGKTLLIWKRTNEGWRIFRQMINFDAPMPAPGSMPAR
jgi:ketosteroid isomerase-like protein